MMFKFDWKKILIDYKKYFSIIIWDNKQHVLISKKRINKVLFDYSNEVVYLDLKEERFFLHGIVVRMSIFGKVKLHIIKNYELQKNVCAEKQVASS